MGGLSKYYRQRLSLFSRPEYNTGVLYSISTCLPAPDRQAGRMRHMFRLMWGCRAHTTGPGPKSRPYSATVRFAGIIITTESLGKWGIYGRGHCSPVRILSVFCLRSFWRQRHYWVALCLKTETLLRDDKRDTTHRISQARLKRYAHHILLLPLMLGTYILPLL